MTYKELEKVQDLARAAFALDEEKHADKHVKENAFRALITKLNAR